MQGTGFTVFSEGNGYAAASGISGDNNLEFTGPGTGNWSRYTVTGTVQFSTPDAQFGINVYSTMPDSCRKYTLLRRTDGKLELRLYTRPQSFATLAVSDSVRAPNAGRWYNFKIQIDSFDIANRYLNNIKAEYWMKGEADPTLNPDYTQWSINSYDPRTGSARLKSGSIGLTANASSGTLYWGPVTVTANSSGTGANIAVVNFKPDTLVDVAPYTPVDCHPDYAAVKFVTGYDSTSGFILDKHDTALAYWPMPGATYPIACRLIPYSTLPWKNYAFSGEIIKPKGTVYDSINVGVNMYVASESGARYTFAFGDSSVCISGGGLKDTVVPLGQKFINGDSVYFTVSVSNNGIYNDTVLVPDSSITLYLSIGTTQIFQGVDASASRIVSGNPSVFVDLTGHEDQAVAAFRFKNFSITTVDNQ